MTQDTYIGITSSNFMPVRLFGTHDYSEGVLRPMDAWGELGRRCDGGEITFSGASGHDSSEEMWFSIEPNI